MLPQCACSKCSTILSYHAYEHNGKAVCFECFLKTFEYREEDHPRADDGKWTDKGSGTGISDATEAKGDTSDSKEKGLTPEQKEAIKKRGDAMMAELEEIHRMSGKSKLLEESFPKNISDDLHSFKRETYEYHREKCIAFTADGTHTLEKEGSHNKIRFTYSECNKMVGSAVFVHNHPGSDSMSFSNDDLYFASRIGAGSMVVTSNRYIDVLTPNNGVWPDKATLRRGVIGPRSKNNKMYRQEYRRITDLEYEGKITSGLYYETIRELRERTSYLAIKDVAAKFNMTYTREVR